MNRWIFYIALAIPFLLLSVFGTYFMDLAGAFILLYYILIVTFRRKYLNLKPIWAAPGKDILKYFTKP